MIRASAVIAVLAALIAPASAQAPTVAVLGLSGHPGTEGCLEGLRKGLPSVGYSEGENVQVTFEAADGAEELDSLVRQTVQSRPAVIVPVSAPAAIAVAEAAGDIPIVFCGVPDPVSSGLAEDLIRPGGKVTGVTDMPPLSEQLALINEIVPGANMLGFVYDPEDETSLRLIERLETFAPGAGFRLAMAEAKTSDEVEAAVQSLVDEVNAIYIPPDETVLRAFDRAVTVAEEASVPLFTGNAEWVERGAVGSLGFDYAAVGQQAAALVARVLDGESPAEIPISPAESTYLVINSAAAERMGLELSPGFLARANAVVE